MKMVKDLEQKQVKIIIKHFSKLYVHIEDWNKWNFFVGHISGSEKKPGKGFFMEFKKELRVDID